mmetsp:Transcript_14420/g.38233  ORF Transcript_14420/g.38233 Transcript_14420/m.38233 type:complete len:86 (+) Transcript_14420:1291-1548(+)
MREASSIRVGSDRLSSIVTDADGPSRSDKRQAAVVPTGPAPTTRTLGLPVVTSEDVVSSSSPSEPPDEQRKGATHVSSKGVRELR